METSQEPNHPGAKKPRDFSGYVIWPVVTVVIYILSSGPALWLDRKHGWWPSIYIHRVYQPVAWLYDHTPLHKPLGIYWHWWASEGYDDKGNVEIVPD